MAQMTEEMKAGYQMIFNGIVKITKTISMEPEYRKDWNDFLKEYWPVIKEYGNPESTKSSPESDAWWTEYIGKANSVINRHYRQKEKADIIKIFYMFIFEVIEFAGRRKEVGRADDSV